MDFKFVGLAFQGSGDSVQGLNPKPFDIIVPILGTPKRYP